MISSSSEWVLHSFKQWRLIMLYGACLSMPYVSCIDNFSSKCVYDALMTKTDSKNWFCWTYLRYDLITYSKVFLIFRCSRSGRNNYGIVVSFFNLVACYLVISNYI